MPTPSTVLLRRGIRVPEPIIQVLRAEFPLEVITNARDWGFPPAINEATCQCSTCGMGRRIDELLNNPERIPEQYMAEARERARAPATLGELNAMSPAELNEYLLRAASRDEAASLAATARQLVEIPVPPSTPTPEPIVNTTTEKPLATTVLPTDAVIFKLCRDLTKRLERREGYSNVRYCVLPDFHKARGYVRIALFECGSSGTTEASQYECASFGYIDRLTGNSMSNIGREVRGNVNDPRLVECFTHYGFVPSPVITASLTPAT